jgi:hypothetical protein
MSKTFDPWRAEQRAVWRNRYARMRAAPAEPLFHALAYAAFAALLAPLLSSALADSAPAIRAGLSHRPVAACLIATAMFALQQSRSLGLRTRARMEGWLARARARSDAALVRFEADALIWIIRGAGPPFSRAMPE